MNYKDKAKAIVQEIYQPMGLINCGINSNEMWTWAKCRALEVVEQIVEALRITTSHCTLRKLDQHEVNNDFTYWQQVHDEIHKL